MKKMKILLLFFTLMCTAISGVFAAGAKMLTQRIGHTTTLLPNGNILITGGHTGDNVPISSCEMYISSKAVYETMSSMSVPRSSHTATLLPNGNVLVYGGYDTASTVTDKAQIFNPETCTWGTPTGLSSLGGAAGHTATLLSRGLNKNKVLVCGGNSSPTVITDICGLINYSGTNTINGSVFLQMQKPRKEHTATLLSNGNVLISGGRTTSDVYLPSNEILDVESGTFLFNSGSLSITRKDHANVSFLDGRVAIIGGYNKDYKYSSDKPYDTATNDDCYNEGNSCAGVAVRHNIGFHGYLDTVELFDKYGKPSIISGADSGLQTLPYRLSRSAGVLSNDGRILLYGGRGNIPVTFADIAVTFGENSSLVMFSNPVSSGGVYSVGIDTTSAGTKAQFNLAKTTLSRPVSGRIINGDIFIPTSNSKGKAVNVGSSTNGGLAISFEGQDGDNRPKKDIRAVLDGLDVGWYNKDYPNKSGIITADAVSLTDLAGNVTFYPIESKDVPQGKSFQRATSNDPAITCNNSSYNNNRAAQLTKQALGNTTCYDKISANDSSTYYVRVSSVTFDLKIDNFHTVYDGALLSGSVKINEFEIKTDSATVAATDTSVFNKPTAYFSNVKPICTGIGTDKKCSLNLKVTYTLNRGTLSTSNPLIGVLSGVDTSASFQLTYLESLITGSSATVPKFNATISFYANKLNLADVNYEVDTSTVVIRDMIFSNNLSYRQSDSSWDYTTTDIGGDNIYEYTAAPKALEYLTPALIDADIIITAAGTPMVLGGKTCRNCKRTNTNSTAFVHDVNEAEVFGVPLHNTMIPTMQSFPTGGSGGTLNTPRNANSATALPNKKLLVCGGSNGNKTLSSCELYDPTTNTWSYTGSMRTPRSGHTATLLPNGRVMMSGGTDGHIALNSSEIYNPKSGVFVDTVTYMTTPRQNHTATLLPNGNVFVVGGSTSSWHEIFITTKSAWQKIFEGNASTTIGLKEHTATLLKNGRVAVIGGLASGLITNRYYTFDPINNGWATTGVIGKNVSKHVAVLDKDGRVILIGGTSGSTRYSDVTAYTFTNSGVLVSSKPVGKLKDGVTGHAAMLMPNNTLLVTGGQTAASALSSVYVVYPDLGMVNLLKGVTIKARANHAMLIDAEGNYYVVGGDDGKGQFIADVDKNYFTVTPDYYAAANTVSARRPAITNSEAENVRPGASLTLLSSGTVNNFHGYTEASGGYRVNHNTPRLVLYAMDNPSGFLVDISTRIYSSSFNSNSNISWDTMMSSITVKLPGSTSSDGSGTVNNELPWGYYYAVESVNGQFSNFKPIQVGESWDIPQVSEPVTPLSTATVSIPSYPLHPLSGYAVYTSSVVWTWPHLPDLLGLNKYISGYNVYSATTTVEGPVLGTVPITDRTGVTPPIFEQKGLQPNSRARIKVLPYNIWTEGAEPTASDYFYTFASTVTLSIDVVNFQDARLSWKTNNSTPTYYEIAWCKSDAINSNCFSNHSHLVSSGTANSFADGACYPYSTYTITGLDSVKNYWFRVRAINGECSQSDWQTHKHSSGYTTDWSNAVSTVTVSAVQDLTGSPSTHEITWSWKEITELDHEHSTLIYKVKSIGDENNTVVNISTTNASYASYSQLGLRPNTPYQISVQPILTEKIGNIVSAVYYGAVSTSPVVYTIAEAPTGLTLTPQISTSTLLKATWNNGNNGANTTYVLSLSTTSDFSVVTETVTLSGTEHVFSNLVPNTYYTAKVYATNSSPDIQVDSAISTCPFVCTYAMPPASLTLSLIGTSGISVTWNKNGNPDVYNSSGVQVGTKYEVSISTDGSFSSSVETYGNSQTFSGLYTDTTYNIKVISYNQEGGANTGGSVAASITTASGQPGVPSGSVSGLTSPTNAVDISGTFANGRYVSLYVPAAAYTKPTEMAISPAEGVNVCAQVGIPIIAAKIYAEDPAPNVPLDFTIGYFIDSEAPALEPAADDILLARYNAVTNSCLPLQTTFDSSSKRISASINTFDVSVSSNNATIIQVIKRAPVTTLDEINIYPNPLYLSRGDGYVTIEPVPAKTRLTLYTLSGSKIWEGSSGRGSVIVWKGENQHGYRIASGIYLGVIDSPAGKKKIKIAVER